MITIENLNLNKFVKTDEFIFILGDIRSNLIIANNIITIIVNDNTNAINNLLYIVFSCPKSTADINICCLSS